MIPGQVDTRASVWPWPGERCPAERGVLTMSVWPGERPYLDLCVPSAGIGTPYELTLDAEAQVANPVSVLVFPIRIVHAHKPQMQEINETRHIQAESIGLKCGRGAPTRQSATPARGGRSQLCLGGCLGVRGQTFQRRCKQTRVRGQTHPKPFPQNIGAPKSCPLSCFQKG